MLEPLGQWKKAGHYPTFTAAGQSGLILALLAATDLLSGRLRTLATVGALV